MIEKVEVLEDHADARLGPGMGQPRHRTEHPLLELVANVPSVDQHLPTVDVLEVVDQSQEGALARSARSHQDHDLALAYVEVDAMKDLAPLIGLAHAAARDECSAFHNR